MINVSKYYLYVFFELNLYLYGGFYFKCKLNKQILLYKLLEISKRNGQFKENLK